MAVMNKLNKIIFFDGVCVLCNSSVDFLMNKDKKGRLRYAALQSDYAATVLPDEKRLSPGRQTVIFLDEGTLYTESTAILRILANLPFPWCLISGLLIVPRFIRNPVYRYIARNRYRWFGKRENCRMPDEITRERILE